jgi:hypothetical protein
MDLRSGIQRTAGALGMDPLDLATIVSYETGGTFDPAQPGPTTQWGQHRGLIQFGEPQARRYGVDWNDPLGSQLGEDGAIARYYRDNGWQPGMGLLDAYSIVNAGAPGLYNASDANNGGAPGTVADKVRDQMDGHRQNAQRLLGGNPTMSTRNAPQGGAQAPQQAAQEPQSIWDRLGILQDEDRRQRLAMGLEGMTLNPNQALIQSLQGDIQARAEAQEEQQAQAQAQEQARQQRNRTVEALRQIEADPQLIQLAEFGYGREALKEALRRRQQEGAGYRQVRGADLGMTGESAERIFNVGPDGKVTGIGSSSTSVNVNTGDQGPQIGTIPQGYQTVTDPETGALRMEPIPGGPVEQEERAEADAKVQSADTLLSTINGALEDPALDKAVGVGGRINELLGPFAPEAARGQSYVDQLSGQVFLDAYNELRGGGTITEIEGQRAEAAKARLNENLSPEDFRAALTELKRVTENARARALGQPIPHPEINASPDGSGFAPTGSNGGATHRFNPATGQVEPIE